MRPASIIALLLLLGAVFGTAARGGTSVRVRFPAFALRAGERIMGVTLTASSGKIFAGCRPNRWTCDENGSSIHCYSLHPDYATAVSGMLPEFIVRSGESAAPSFEASVELIDNDGKEYSRDIRAGDLIVK